MTDKTRPDRPADDLEHRLARFFRSEVERARVDLAGRPLANRPAMVSRAALPFGPLAAAGVIVVLALLLRAPGAGEPPGASVQGGQPGTNASSPSAPSPSASQQPSSEDWALITWSLTPTEPFDGPGNQFLEDVTAWGEGFVAVGHECCGGMPGTGIVWASTDGRSWERVPDREHVFQAATLDFIEAAGDQLVVGGKFGETAAVWLSDDGRDWRLATPGDPFDGGHVEGMAWGPAGLIAYGWQGDHGVTWSSRDGISWEPDAATFRDSGSNGPTVAGTAWGYVATSEAGAWRSADGRSWTRATVQDHARLGWVVVGAGGMLATGETGPLPDPNIERSGSIIFPEYWHSVDGRAWQRLPAFRQPAGLGDILVSDGSRIVAVGRTREIRTSTDALDWRKLDVTADQTIDLELSPLTGFSRAAVGRHGIVGADHATLVGRDDDAGVWLWFGAATATVPRQIEKLPLLHNDGRNDAMCIGGEGGDPGVVCIEIGYYLRNESPQDRLVRLSGAVEALLIAPAGSVGRVTEIGPVWDSGLPVVVEVLSDDCQVIQRLLPTGDLALIVIPAEGQARIEAPPPPEPLPQTPFAAADACTG